MKSRGYQQVWLGGAPKPSTFAWIVALFAIVVQQHEVSNPLLLDPNAMNVHMDRVYGTLPEP